MTKEQFSNWYDKNYKKLLVLPILILLFSLSYIAFFYYQNNDIIRKDVSLTGGTTITIFSQVPVSEIQQILSSEFSDLSIRALSDNTGKQTQLIITVSDQNPDKLKSALEKYLGYELTEDNSSTEFTGSSLSQDFYKQLRLALVLAFLLMALVVFLIYAKGIKPRLIVILVTFITFLTTRLSSTIALIFTLIGIILLIYLYIKYSVPSFAVVLSAFADITMTLAFVNLIGIKVSTAGIVAFLMLIGYSVDTDVLLTTRMLKRKENTNTALYGAFKTGITMTLTSIAAIAAALFFIYSISDVLGQIFTILLIGLFFDIFNTWITNASIIKWYIERK